MGTYPKLVIKDQKEGNIDRINRELHKLGYPTHILNQVPYGAFITRKRLEEDARFLNVDPEGLKQIIHMKRPITSKLLEEFFWNKVGTFIAKTSSFNEDEQGQWEIVFNYAHRHKNDFGWKASENCSKEKLRGHGFEVKGE